jgi:hypothetical protein
MEGASDVRRGPSVSRRRLILAAAAALLIAALLAAILLPPPAREAKASLTQIFDAQMTFYGAHHYFACGFGELGWLPRGRTRYSFFITRCGDVFAAEAVGNPGTRAAGSAWRIDHNKDVNRDATGPGLPPAAASCVGYCGGEQATAPKRGPEEVLRDYFRYLDNGDLAGVCSLRMTCSRKVRSMVVMGTGIRLDNAELVFHDADSATVRTESTEPQPDSHWRQDWYLVRQGREWKIDNTGNVSEY